MQPDGTWIEVYNADKQTGKPLKNESTPEGQSEINGIGGQFVREDYPYLNDLEFEKLIDTANPEAAAPVLTKVNTVNAATQKQHKSGVSVKDYIDNLYNEGYRLRGLQFISEGKNPIELSNNKIEKDYALLAESLQPTIETPISEAILPQNPKEEREFGYKIDKGIRYDRKNPIDNKVEGNETNLEFSNNSKAPAGKWTVIDASEVQPSHVGKHRNPFHFIAEAQPKERTDTVSDVASEIIADKLSPEKITNKTTNAFYGAPTVNTRGEVIQGNNRSISLQKYWNKYPSDPRGYKQYLIDHAQEMGLDPERIAAMKNPVLVNMVDISDDQAISFGQYKESDLTTGGIQRISASETARKLKDKLGNFITMLTNSVDDTMSLRDTIASNALQALKYLHSIKAINDTQYQSALNKNIVTGDAIRDLQDIMTFSIFEGGRADLNDLFELLPYNLKIGIIKSTPNIMKEGGLKEEIQRMIIANQYFVNSPWKDSGAKAVPAWSKNVDMLNPVTPEAEFGKVVVSLLHRLLSAKTQREVLLFFNEYDLLANGGKGLIPEPAIGRVKAIEKLLNVPENEQGRVFAKLRTDSNETPSDGRGNELAPGQSPDKGSGTPIQGAGKENAAGKEPGEVTPPAQQPAQEPGKPGSQPQSEQDKDTPAPVDQNAPVTPAPEIVTPIEAAIEKGKKEPFEITRDEYIQSKIKGLKGYELNEAVTKAGEEHKKAVEQAINDGKITEHSDYPDLQAKKKEPWEMTSEEWFNYKYDQLPKKVKKAIQNNERGYVTIPEIREQTDGEHKRNIEKALSEGKPVPESVLKDYPELKKQETPRTNTIVPDVNNGKTINDIWIEWNKIKSEKDHTTWAEIVKSTKFGTYGSIPFAEVLNKFEPKFPNDIQKRDFITDVETAMGYTPEQLTYKPKSQNVDEFFNEKPKPEAKAEKEFDEDHVSRNLDDYKNEPEKESSKVYKE